MRQFVILMMMLLNAHWLPAQNTIPLISDWQFRESGTDEWLPATVPGTVHTDLMAAGKIPDPFFGINEKLVQWVEEKNWEYRCVFSLSDSNRHHGKATLVFEGLDTYASVSLNGKLILQADNMFRRWEIPVDSILLAGDNILTVDFVSPVARGKQLAAVSPIALPVDERIYTRKAQYHYGWDWGPRLVTSGIWLPVYLKYEGVVSLQSVQVITEAINTVSATVLFNSQIVSDTATDIALEIADASGAVIYSKNYLVNKGDNHIQSVLHIDSPRLWWTHDLGEPYLYNYTIRLYLDKIQASEKTVTFGIRTIELVTTPDSAGTAFYFKLNQRPVFMRGANFIPTNSFLPGTTDSAYRSQLNDVKLANMNMLRIWGGGIYEKDIFYQLCDSLGILVWQDFMFACAMYPGDSAFLSNVTGEITCQVQRLRNHPCIALWCGNNEVDEAWHNWGWQQKYTHAERNTIWSWYNTLFDTIIPTVLHTEDGTRDYWPSSPSIGWGHAASLANGDSHYWGVWWGNQPFDYYNHKVGRFMSEYGFQGMPSLRSFRQFTPVHDMIFDSPTLKTHQKHPVGYETIHKYLIRDFPHSAQLENYIYLSQMLQAEGIATAIEAHRRSMPYCMGTLFWQMNDCWPVTSWSAVDFYGNRKALYYAAKRSFAPLTVSIAEQNGTLQCYVIRSGNALENITAIVEEWLTNGELIHTDTLRLNVPPDSVFICHTFRNGIYTQKNEKVIRVRLMQQDSVMCTYFAYLVPPKDLQLQMPEVHIEFNRDKNMLKVNTNVFTRGIYLYSDNSELKLNDNFFDLVPGETKYILLEQNFSGETEAIKYKSLNTIR